MDILNSFEDLADWDKTGWGGRVRLTYPFMSIQSEAC
jgi:hypothetical protein